MGLPEGMFGCGRGRWSTVSRTNARFAGKPLWIAGTLMSEAIALLQGREGPATRSNHFGYKPRIAGVDRACPGCGGIPGC